MKPGRPWSSSDLARLRTLWHEISLERISAQLGRTPLAVYAKAREIGLPCGVPQGCESLSAAARRTGYTRPDLRRLLHEAGVYIYRVDTYRARRTKTPNLYVDSCDVDRAIDARNATETVLGAALRRGIGREVMRRLVHRAGFKSCRRGAAIRVPTVLIDRLVSEYRERKAA